MKKNVLAALCVALLAIAIVAPVGLSAKTASQVAVVSDVTVENNPVVSHASSATGLPGTMQGLVSFDTSDEPYGGAEYEQGVALVTFADESTDAQSALAQLQEDTGLTGLEIASEGSGYVEISIPSDYATDEAVARISASSVVDSAQPNFLYELAEEDDPSSLIAPAATLNLQTGEIELSTQAEVNDPRKGDQWYLKTIGAYKAWDTVQCGNVSGKIVTVAVLDNCFNLNHEDLQGSVVAETSITGASMGDTSNQKTPYHGTHVAGIIAARTNNGIGVAGLSYNARIMPIRISRADGGIDTKSLIEAYTYVMRFASTYNVKVINMSVGSGRSSLHWSETDKQLFSAINKAYLKGIVTVVPACNTSSSSSVSAKAPFYAFPADYDRCVTVINTTDQDKRNSNSNYNVAGQTTKDISAPGTSILSTGTASNSSYVYSSGTSMAAPVVSGTLALMFAKAQEEGTALSADQAVSRLYSTAVDINTSGWDAETGFGRVNTYAAVTGGAAISGTNSVKLGSTTTFSFSGPSGSSLKSWSSADTSVATVSGSGVVTGVGIGSTVITAKYTQGGQEKTAKQSISVYDPTILSETSSFVIANARGTMTCNDTAQLGVKDDQPTANWTWSSSNDSVVSVGSSTGAITAKGAGSATVTVALAEAPSVSASVYISVKPADIANASVTLSQSSFVYDGAAKTPGVTSVKMGSRTLVEGSDYKVVSYSNNVDAGLAKITIMGLGSYYGTKTKDFAIEKAPLSTIELSPSVFAYDGSAKNPTVIVRGPKDGAPDQELRNGVDYVLDTPSGCIQVGSYTFTATGGGNYTGSISASFTITMGVSSMHRLYNPNTGEHFYTADENERSYLTGIGWQYEGVGWTSPAENDKPVYRLYNRSAGDHHYTPDVGEYEYLVDVGWEDEGIGWYSEDESGIPLYRQYNPNAEGAGSHNYTADENERDFLVNNGWNDEGVGWYGCA